MPARTCHSTAASQFATRPGNHEGKSHRSRQTLTRTRQQIEQPRRFSQRLPAQLTAGSNPDARDHLADLRGDSHARSQDPATIQ